MAEKENKQKHKSTIDKYFDRTAKAYKTWCDENKEERNFLQIAAEYNWDVSKEGGKVFDFHIAYSGKADILASGLMHSMMRDGFVRLIIIGAAKKFLMDKYKHSDNETDY